MPVWWMAGARTFVTLGKIAIVPAVRKFAEQNQVLFLEAERPAMNNEVANLERELENKRAKLEERELAEVTEALKRLR
jgi:Skp family chaperone for outer membrane proteins